MVKLRCEIVKSTYSFYLVGIIFLGLLAVSWIDGCGGDGGDATPEPGNNGSAPSISNLRYSPAGASVGCGGGEVTVTGLVDFADDDRNVSRLIIDLFDDDGNQIYQMDEPFDPAGYSIFKFALIVNTSVAGDYTFNIYLIDSSDLKSNVLTGDFSVGGNLLFQSSLVFSTGSSPYDVVAGDLDKDGDLDLAVANYDSNDVSVLFNQGDGTFAGRVDYWVGGHPCSVVAGDLDGDGDLDLAVAKHGSNISVLLNQGDGTFAMAIDYSPEALSNDVAAGDLDGDGDLDLAVTSYDEGFSILWNQGDGTFVMPERIAGGDLPQSIGIWDLDGDADLDVAVANGEWTGDALSGCVSVLLNYGDGTFAWRVDYWVGGHPCSVVAGDLDGDADLDVAVATGSYYISVLLNYGDGTFAERAKYNADDNTHSVVVGDLDDDAYLDLVVATHSNYISVLLNQGDGTFATEVYYGTGDDTYSLALGDLDGNDYLDLAVANNGSDSISIFLNEGNN